MNKETTVWKEIIPSVWEYNNGTVHVSIVSGHRDHHEAWVMNCIALGISTKLFSLISRVNTEQAQQLALNIVRQKALNIAESLNS
jgi:hypothetical protein